jgi:hypothetical protein
MWCGTPAASRRGSDVEAVRCEPRDDTVVANKTILSQHQAVLATTLLKPGEITRVHAIEKFGRIGADNLDLTES